MCLRRDSGFGVWDSGFLGFAVRDSGFGVQDSASRCDQVNRAIVMRTFRSAHDEEQPLSTPNAQSLVERVGLARPFLPNSSRAPPGLSLASRRVSTPTSEIRKPRAAMVPRRPVAAS